MARPLRICAPDVVYHVTARGNGGAAIFADDEDRHDFLTLFAKVLDRYGWICHAYCLMGNHYHLVVETPRSNLPRGMRAQNGPYAQRFNRRHGRRGHLFEARYRSVLVERETHLLEVSRYVVLNPVRAGLCPDPAGWPWSSYAGTIGGRGDPLLDGSGILGMFADRRSLAGERYRRFVLDGIGVELSAEIRGERLGSERFLARDLGGGKASSEIPRDQLKPLRPSLEQVFLSEPTPIAAAYRIHGYRLWEIGKFLDLHPSSVSRRLRGEEAVLACQA